MRTNEILRLGMCLVVTTASVAVLAQENRPTPPLDQQERSTKVTVKGDRAQVSYDPDVGAGGAEPQGRGRGDGQAKERAAIQEYNQRQFLDQTWSSP